MTPVSSWGCLSAHPHHLIHLSDSDRVSDMICDTSYPAIAHGMGRSYGDVCLNAHNRLWMTTGLDRFISFDDKTGRLVCEAGVLLRDIQRLMIPRGWILPVTPGTQFVTLGGAIANDVHGKNHHMVGSFGDHICALTLVRTDGEVINCTPDERPDWLKATIGGLGLTGVITRAEIQLRRVDGSWLEVETIPYEGLDVFFQLADESEAQWEHTVSWIDCLSADAMRGVFMRANHIALERQPPRVGRLTIPAVAPVSLVNHMSLRAFNTAYYHMKKQQSGMSVTHYEKFFYPLDSLLQWNRLYGKKGFFQYQAVVPRNVGYDTIQAMIKEIARCGEGSFLSVLKTFGDRHPCGMLSFPQAGVTLALDFPNRGEKSHTLFERLDALVGDAKGRLYPAKDARMPRALFEAGYPNLSEFMTYRDAGIASDMSRRLMGEIT